MKQNVRKKLIVLLKVGVPYTIGGVLIIYLGIYLLKRLFPDSDYLTAMIFIWLAFFWFIYQPLFRKKIMGAKKLLEKQ
ncbi:MAG: hypothetical protein U9P07_02185 [Pseudomonadota bacterium]|nr:hypothetical protein [Pseudomonadota bacterium]